MTKEIEPSDEVSRLFSNRKTIIQTYRITRITPNKNVNMLHFSQCIVLLKAITQL